MSRKKKSRKIPSNGPVRLSQDKLKEMRALKEQRVKKTKGAKPGSRNSVDALQPETAKNNQQNKDKRVGSKKPIPRVAAAPEPEMLSTSIAVLHVTKSYVNYWVLKMKTLLMTLMMKSLAKLVIVILIITCRTI